MQRSWGHSSCCDRRTARRPEPSGLEEGGREEAREDWGTVVKILDFAVREPGRPREILKRDLI